MFSITRAMNYFMQMITFTALKSPPKIINEEKARKIQSTFVQPPSECAPRNSIQNKVTQVTVAPIRQEFKPVVIQNIPLVQKTFSNDSLVQELKTQVSHLEKENAKLFNQIGQGPRTHLQNAMPNTAVLSLENERKQKEVAQLHQEYDQQLDTIDTFNEEVLSPILKYTSEVEKMIHDRLKHLREITSKLDDETAICKNVFKIDQLENLEKSLQTLEGNFQFLLNNQSNIHSNRKDEETLTQDLIAQIDRLNQEQKILIDLKSNNNSISDTEELKEILIAINAEYVDLTKEATTLRSRIAEKDQFVSELTNHLIDDYLEPFKKWFDDFKRVDEGDVQSAKAIVNAAKISYFQKVIVAQPSQASIVTNIVNNAVLVPSKMQELLDAGHEVSRQLKDLVAINKR